MRKFWLIIASLLILIYLTLEFLSPVRIGSNGGLVISESINIEKPVSEVFTYMGNSDNASIWSVYVHHIELLSGQDGKKGCVRRCFKGEDSTDIHWDETILEVVTDKYRKLNIYNAHHFPIYTEGLTTEQIYTGSDSSCSLTLSLCLPADAGFFDRLKFKIGAFVVSDVFEGNLHNIQNELSK